MTNVWNDDSTILLLRENQYCNKALCKEVVKFNKAAVRYITIGIV